MKRMIIVLCCAAGLAGCASLVSKATNGMAQNLSLAMLNQNDPEIVRDGAPAYLLMLDSFIQGSPDDPAMLGAAAELYAAYGVVFVAEAERASILTQRALGYGERAICASNDQVCNVANIPFEDFQARLGQLKAKDVAPLFSWGLSWMAYIKVHSGDFSALAKLPRARAVILRVAALDGSYQAAKVEHYLGVLDTIRPPALGGDFAAGQKHFERAMALSGHHDLSIAVDYARYYARTLYDRELHDRILTQVVQSDAEYPGHTLFNTIARKQAQALLDEADDYF